VAENSSIEWMGTTWKLGMGCTNISTGCDNCYAVRFLEPFFGLPGHPFDTGFDQTLKPERLTQPLEWKRLRMIGAHACRNGERRDALSSRNPP
jgi:protein gp37